MMAGWRRSAGRWLTIFALLLPGLVPGWAMAQSVAHLAESPTLRLAGNIDGRSMVVRSDEFGAIGRETIRAEVPWSAGFNLYEGVPLARLLDHVGAAGQDLEIVDHRGHSLGMAIADAVARDAFVVDRHAAAEAALGKRGPFWLVFPLPPDGQPAMEPPATRPSLMGPPAVAGIVELRIR